jgi:hypothetical protein
VIKLKITINGKKFPRSGKNSHGQKKISMLRTKNSIFGKKFPRLGKKFPYLENISHSQEKIPTLNNSFSTVSRRVSRPDPDLTW